MSDASFNSLENIDRAIALTFECKERGDSVSVSVDPVSLSIALLLIEVSVIDVRRGEVEALSDQWNALAASKNFAQKGVVFSELEKARAALKTARDVYLCLQSSLSNDRF